MGGTAVARRGDAARRVGGRLGAVAAAHVYSRRLSSSVTSSSWLQWVRFVVFRVVSVLIFFAAWYFLLGSCVTHNCREL